MVFGVTSRGFRRREKYLAPPPNSLQTPSRPSPPPSFLKETPLLEFSVKKPPPPPRPLWHLGLPLPLPRAETNRKYPKHPPRLDFSTRASSTVTPPLLLGGSQSRAVGTGLNDCKAPCDPQPQTRKTTSKKSFHARAAGNVAPKSPNISLNKGHFGDLRATFPALEKCWCSIRGFFFVSEG